MDNGIISDAELLARVKQFIAQHSLKPSTFGRLTIGDGNLISDLQKGRSLTLKRAKKVCDFMSEYSRKSAIPAKANKGYAQSARPKGARA